MTKTKTKSMTITEMASVSDVAVASVSALVSKLGLKPTKTGKYNAKYYSPEDTERVLEHYRSKSKTNAKTSSRPTQLDLLDSLRELVKQQTSEIEVLRHQLDVKDRQIEILQRLVDQAQKLDLTTHKQSEPNRLLETKTETKRATTDSHGLLYKLFH